jgi:cold shock CspA family protein
MTIGTVTSLDSARGYGFIRSADSPRAIFVAIPAGQWSGPSTLSLGQEVEYEVACDRGGTLIARNLRIPAFRP